MCRTRLRPTGAPGADYVNASFVDVSRFVSIISILVVLCLFSVMIVIFIIVFILTGIQAQECLHSNPRAND